MISFKNINFSYRQQVILNNVSAEVAKGSLTALIGPNGAGKSTLLNILARLLRLDSGEVFFDGHSLFDTPDRLLARILAVLTQETRIDSRITVEDLLTFGRYPFHGGRPKQEDLDIVATMLTRFQLEPFQHRYLDELSGGQRQRAFIAMVFCQSTDYVLLDEPLNNLDMYHENKLMRLIKQSVVAEGRTIVVVLHDINQAIAYADNIIAMKDGEIAFSGAPETVITPDNIHALFNVEADIIEHDKRKIVVVK